MDEKSFKKLLDEAIAPLRQDIEELKDVQENRLLPSVTEVEITVKSYADSYKINKGNIERLDERLTTVEDQLEIQPSDQLAIQR